MRCLAGRMKSSPRKTSAHARTARRTGRKPSSRRLPAVLKLSPQQIGALLSEEHLEALMDHNPSLIFLKDVQGRYVYLNAAYERAFVHSKDWYGKTDYDFWPKESAELFRANDAAVLRANKLHQFLEDSTDLNGQRHCWLCYKFPFTNSAGQRYVGGIGLDDTERVLAQEALRESRDKFQTIVETNNDFIWEIDAQGRYTYCSPQMETRWGIKPEAMLGKTPFEMMPPDQSQAALKFFSDLVKTPQAFSAVELIAHDGRQNLIHLEVSGRPFFGEQGQLLGYRGVTRDVTERKAAQLRLAASEQKYSRLHETMRDAFVITDMQGRILDFNHAYRDMLGYTHDELQRLTYLDLTPKQWHPVEARIVAEQILPLGFSDVYEKEYRKKDGTVFPVELRTCLIRDEAGAPIQMWAIVRDISERKKTETEIQKYRQHLEELVNERTASLQKAVEELEHFSYSITHDMRSPLRTITSLITILEEELPKAATKQTKDCFRLIRTGARRMDQLITDALQYSKAGKQDLPLQPVDIGHVLRDIINTYPNLRAHKSAIRLRGKFPQVLANEAGLAQCLSNLLGNAVKFVRPKTKPRIRVYTAPAPSAKRRVTTNHPMARAFIRLWIEDQGIGIPAASQPRVFQLFQKGTSRYEGTGLGLALAKKVIENMGGRIGFESTEGKGTRFWVDLRLYSATV